MKKHIPNFITLLNLSSGLIALIYAFDDNYLMAFLWICLGIFFDFWDGFVARLLNVKSELGLQLDSMADMVTSGVVPGLIMYKLLSNIQTNHDVYNLSSENLFMGILPYFGFLITLGSAYRLAKFNIDTRQTDSFIGLPTPANALFISSLAIINVGWVNDTILTNPYILIGISAFSAYILNAELPLFSLKMKEKGAFSANKLPYLFVVFSVIVLLLLQYTAIPIIIISYVLVSLLKHLLSKKDIQSA